ncbi:MAG: DUF3626 domain-containing protein [Elusimicrobia bacterium]|nr:DUF3626 domain-containing protein [Elusimicrobiota bacterium]
MARKVRVCLVSALLLCTAASAAPAAPREFVLSAAEVRTKDLRDLAAALVARIKTECDQAAAPVGPSPLEPGRRLVVMVPPQALESIARDGLRNAHETAATGGFLRPFERFEAEQELAMLRLPYGSRGRALLPKYALVRSTAADQAPPPARYGSVALVLKPEVEARATWTYADSLDFSRRAGLYELGGTSNSVLPRTFGYRRRRGDENACVNYCEAQVWGPVTLADVDYAVVPADASVPAEFARAVAVRRGPSAAAGSPDASTAGLRRGLEMGQWSDATLLAAVAASSGPERARLIGELAERAPTPDTLAALDGLAASPSAFERELALYGLSAGPWPRFKPRLLAGLRDVHAVVAVEAVALAAEHRSDADVARALARLRADLIARDDPDRRVVKEWLDRQDAPSFCPDTAR